MTKLSAKSRGFGIIEVLIAGAIIIAVLATLTMTGRQSLRNASYTEEKNQAYSLAQEGIETVRQIRDTNWRDNKGRAWDFWEWNGTELAQITAQKCYKIENKVVTVDLPKISRFGLSGEGSCPLADDQKESVKVGKTVYLRTIKIEPLTTDMLIDSGTDIHSDINALKVTVFVGWDSSLGHREISVSELLTNWRPNY